MDTLAPIQLFIDSIPVLFKSPNFPGKSIYSRNHWRLAIDALNCASNNFKAFNAFYSTEPNENRYPILQHYTDPTVYHRQAITDKHLLSGSVDILTFHVLQRLPFGGRNSSNKDEAQAIIDTKSALKNFWITARRSIKGNDFLSSSLSLIVARKDLSLLNLFLSSFPESSPRTATAELHYNATQRWATSAALKSSFDQAKEHPHFLLGEMLVAKWPNGISWEKWFVSIKKSLSAMQAEKRDRYEHALWESWIISFSNMFVRNGIANILKPIDFIEKNGLYLNTPLTLLHSTTFFRPDQKFILEVAPIFISSVSMRQEPKFISTDDNRLLLKQNIIKDQLSIMVEHLLNKAQRSELLSGFCNTAAPRKAKRQSI
jgi:hypothetical protein